MHTSNALGWVNIGTFLASGITNSWVVGTINTDGDLTSGLLKCVTSINIAGSTVTRTSDAGGVG